MKEEYSTIEDAVRHTYASVVWSHKIQEKQADIYIKQYKIIAVINILAASLTSVGIVSIIFTDEMILKLISAFISFATIFISAYLKLFDLQAMETKHKTSAIKLLEIRDKFQLLILKIKLADMSTVELAELYEKLLMELDTAYKEAPSTTDRAVQLAKAALCIKKDNTFSDEEIDSYLPEQLRKGKL